jgi:hypothetical protein
MTKLIKIADIKYIQNYILEIMFDDGCIKRFDFAELFDFKGIQETLQPLENFRRVKISDNRRRIYWENDYDCCADWLRYFAKDVEHEWAGFDETVDLKQRMIIARQKMFSLEEKGE